MSGPPTWAIAADDERYPRQLHDLGAEAPGLIHGVGERDAFAGLGRGSAVTIVGSRRASVVGLRIAGEIAADLARAGVTVVSGMALGIDAAAHRGALEAGGRTVAVLAGGPDVVYPPREAALYRRIVSSGAAISEQPLGTGPRKEAFPARNRIMAALAGYVLIVEAAHGSGSLITARRALQLNRDLGGVPGQVGSAVAAGVNTLIRDGALLVQSAQDVLDALLGAGATSIVRAGPALDPELRRALDLVERGASTADALALASGAEPGRAAVALARLELLGYLEADELRAYTRTALALPAGAGEEPDAGL